MPGIAPTDIVVRGRFPLLLPQPLHRATLLRRYKRFLADLRLDDGREVVAHVADPGRLPELAVPGARAWLSHHTTPGRRLNWSLQLLEAPGGALVGMNTGLANRIVADALAAGRVTALGGIHRITSESSPVPGTRLDFRCEATDGRTIWIEVKNVTWRRADRLAFPDAVTLRGARHLAELARLAQAGHDAVLLFLAQRSDGVALEIARDIDPAYARAFAEARAAGVRMLAYRCSVSLSEINLDAILPMV